MRHTTSMPEFQGGDHNGGRQAALPLAAGPPPGLLCAAPRRRRHSRQTPGNWPAPGCQPASELGERAGRAGAGAGAASRGPAGGSLGLLARQATCCRRPPMPAAGPTHLICARRRAAGGLQGAQKVLACRPPARHAGRGCLSHPTYRRSMHRRPSGAAASPAGPNPMRGWCAPAPAAAHLSGSLSVTSTATGGKVRRESRQSFTPLAPNAACAACKHGRHTAAPWRVAGSELARGLGAGKPAAAGASSFHACRQQRLAPLAQRRPAACVPPSLPGGAALMRTKQGALPAVCTARSRPLTAPCG